MKEKHHLSSLTFLWKEKDTFDANENGEMVLQALQPHSNLKELSDWFYDGVRFVDWLSSLTNVVKLYLDGCKRCQYLPPIDHLPCLKSLGIEGFHALEYISDSSPPALGIPFFPSLKKLCLRECPNLKGWWKPDALNGPSMIEDEQQHLSFPSFPCLSLLDIFYCPNLTSMPLYPHLEERLVLWYTSLKPLEQTMITENDDTLATTEVAPSPPASKCCSSLFFLLPQFLSGASNSHVPSSSSPPLSKLLFLLILDIEDIVCVPEIWLRNLTSLKKLHILRCPKLKSIPLSPSPSIQHLTTLEDLWIDECNELDLWKDENFLQWASLKNLRRLTISNCDRLIKLPDGIGNLTSLEELSLFYCSGLESLPEWMCRLTSLKTLEIHSCSDVLHQRCKKEIGEDWSKIAHIQNVFIYPPAE